MVLFAPTESARSSVGHPGQDQPKDAAGDFHLHDRKALTEENEEFDPVVRGPRAARLHQHAICCESI